MADPDGPAGTNAGSTDSDTGSILFVCTANRIRSPFAAAVADRFVAGNDLPIAVSSAGLDEGGLPAMDQMVKVARKWDIDLANHQSRQVTAELIDASDLVIAMTGSHVVDLAGTYPDALARLVTLREVAEAARDTGAPAWNPEAMRAWGAQVAQRPLDVLLGGTVDVADPVGRSKRIHQRTATLIYELIEVLLVTGAATTRSP